MGLKHFILGYSSSQQATVPPEEDTEAWVYFINGQSLAVGTALKSTLSAPLNAPIPRAFIYYKPNATTDNAASFAADNGNWEQLTTENNQLTDIAANNWYGPEIKMAYDLQAFYQRDIYIIKFGIGDTGLGLESGGGILDWDKDSVAELYHRALVDYWSVARDKLIAMGKTPIPKGLYWKQGERDALINASSLIYQSNLEEFFAQYRIDVGAPNMLCVIGQINIHLNVRAYFTRVRNAQIAVGAQENNALINEDGYTISGDNVHYAEYITSGADAAAVFIDESETDPPTDNFTDFNGTSNFVRFGDILDSVFSLNDGKFKLRITLNNPSLVSGIKTIIGKFASTGNQRAIFWYSNGADISFQYIMTVGATTNTRTVTWVGALLTGEHTYEMQYDGAIDTNAGLDRCVLLRDEVAQTRSLTGNTGTLGIIFSGSTAQLSFGNLVDSAGTPSTFYHNGQAKDMIILSGNTDVVELNVPVLSTALDISGNGRNGTFV